MAGSTFVDDSSRTTCTDELFLEIIKESMRPHDEVGPYLGLKSVDLDNIQRDNPAEKTRKLKVLQEWRSQQGSGATNDALAQVFRNMEDRQTADFVMQYDQIHRATMRHEPTIGEVFPERGQRYPNWDKMERVEKVKIKKALVKENFKVRHSYALYLTRICNAVISDSATMSDIKITLTSYIGKTAPELKAANTIPDLFLIVAEHSSWFNFCLVELVLEACNSQRGQAMLAEYKNEVLKPYLKRSIFEVPAESFPCATAGSSYVPCVKIVDDQIDISGEEIIQIIDDLAELLQIPSLQLMRYEIGSVRLIIGIHRDIFEHEMHREKSTLRKCVKWNEETKVHIITVPSDTLLPVEQESGPCGSGDNTLFQCHGSSSLSTDVEGTTVDPGHGEKDLPLQVQQLLDPKDKSSSTPPQVALPGSQTTSVREHSKLWMLVSIVQFILLCMLMYDWLYKWFLIKEERISYIHHLETCQEMRQSLQKEYYDFKQKLDTIFEEKHRLQDEMQSKTSDIHTLQQTVGLCTEELAICNRDKESFIRDAVKEREEHDECIASLTACKNDLEANRDNCTCPYMQHEKEALEQAKEEAIKNMEEVAQQLLECKKNLSSQFTPRPQQEYAQYGMWAFTGSSSGSSPSTSDDDDDEDQENGKNRDKMMA